MFNIHIDVRGAHPTLFHGMRAFRLEQFGRSVRLDQAVEFLQDTRQIEHDDPLVVIYNGLLHDATN